jgi:hypothetical protein
MGSGALVDWIVVHFVRVFRHAVEAYGHTPLRRTHPTLYHYHSPVWVLNNNNPMYVIGHNHKFANLNFRPDFGGFEPFGLDDVAKYIQHNFAIYHRTKHTFFLVNVYRYVIRPGLGVIVVLQTDGAAVVDLGVEFRLVGQSVHSCIIYLGLSKCTIGIVWFAPECRMVVIRQACQPSLDKLGNRHN